MGDFVAIESSEDAEELRRQLEQLCPAAHDVLIDERSFYLAQQELKGLDMFCGIP